MGESADKNAIIARMEVPGRPGLFVLGCYEKRVTIYNQQVRALNLIWALQDRRPASIAVVGAGAAGLTASVAAASCGCRVSVFERLASPLAFIGSSDRRWVHPHIYDWPSECSENPQAGLPFLNWRGNPVPKVVDDLIAQWTDHARDRDIEVHYSVSELSVEPFDKRHLLRWNGVSPEQQQAADQAYEKWGARSGRRMRVKAFDAVILAVGFGLEEPSSEFPCVESYWDRDKIDEEDRLTSRPERTVLVSGSGDGGLIDVLRFSFQRFRHEEVLRDLRERWLGPEAYENVKNAVREIEIEARKLEAEGKHLEWLNLRYRELADSLVFQSKVSLRSNVCVFLTTKNPLPLDLTSSALNRFLFSLSDVQFIPGPLDYVSKEGSEYIAVFKDGRQQRFDNVVVRHGPIAAMQKYFNEVWMLCENARSAVRSSTDPTRDPLFGSFYEGLLAGTQRTEFPTLTPEAIELASIAKVNANEERELATRAYREALIRTVREQLPGDQWPS
jgi:hypothetical protein